MIRLLLAAAVLSSSVASAAPDCEWKEPKDPPTLKDEEGAPKFHERVDSSWFKCARKAGGSATFQWLDAKGQPVKGQKEKKISSASIDETLFQSSTCNATPKLEGAQAKIVGTGAMEKLSFTSELLKIHCARCQFAGDDNSMVMHMQGFLTTPGNATIQGNVNEEWWKCAKEGSTVEMRFFPAATRKEAQEATDPKFVVKGLEAAPKYKKAFPLSQLCAASPKFIGFELFATGEMVDLNGNRAVMEAKCSK